MQLLSKLPASFVFKVTFTHACDFIFFGKNHRGSNGPAEPLRRTTTTTNMAAANFVVKTCNN